MAWAVLPCVGGMGEHLHPDHVAASDAALVPVFVLELVLSAMFFVLVSFSSLSYYSLSFRTFLFLFLFKGWGNQGCVVEEPAFFEIPSICVADD